MFLFDKFSINKSFKTDEHISDKSLFLNYPGAIFTIDLNEQVLSINSGVTKLLGYKVKDGVKDLKKVIVYNDYEKFQYYLHKSFNRIPSSFECNLVHK